MAELMIGLAVIMGVTSGISAAQSYCKYESQIKQVKEQTEQFITHAEKVYDELQQQDQEVQQQTAGLQEAAAAASNNLLQLRKSYVAELQKDQLVALFIVVIVFILLLAKKLKIY
jgi:hypothetical protein